MRKVALIVLAAFMFASCGAMHSARPAEAIMRGDPGVGAFFGKHIWGSVKGCWKACNAPKGRKWDAFKKGYNEATEGFEGKAAEFTGGVIAY